MKKLLIVFVVIFSISTLTACIGALDPMGKRPDSLISLQ